MNESKWWGTFGLNPMPVAARLWNETYGMTRPKSGALGETMPKANEKLNTNGTEVRGGRSKLDVDVSAHDIAKTD